MTIRRTCVVACLALLAGCGGSGSETPPPVEPIAPQPWESEAEPTTPEAEPETEVLEPIESEPSETESPDAID